MFFQLCREARFCVSTIIYGPTEILLPKKNEVIYNFSRARAL